MKVADRGTGVPLAKMSKCLVLFLVLSILLCLAFATDETEDAPVARVATREARTDPCLKKRCSTGKECVIVGDEAKCQCIKDCAENSDLRRRVCSNFNSTWQSDCHLFRHKCLCREGLSEECASEHKKMKIDYYGECQELAECTEDVLSDFPRRMREWLYEVMRTRMERPVSEPGSGLVSKWVNAVIWKFCDLDKSPHDRVVSQDEVFPLRAPFTVYEPCITPFLTRQCDPDGDHKITLAEWGQCLSIPADELEDKCAEFVKLSS